MRPPPDHCPDDKTHGSTQAWARQIHSGEQEAIHALYLRVAPAMYSWAAIRIPAALRQVLDPDEVVQEVWLRAMEKADTYCSTTTPFRPWVFRIAGYVFLEQLRKTARRSVPTDRDDGRGLAVSQIPAEVTSVSRRAARSESIQSLLDEVGFLSDSDRRLLLLRGLEERSHKDVAEDLGLDPTTVMKRWQRLRESLASRLDVREILAS